MTIKARLTGHAFDLDDLVQLFSEGEPCVGKDEHGHYMTSGDLDAASDDAGQMQRVGRELVERINAVGWLLHSEFQPVGLADHFEQNSDTGVLYHLVLSADVSARARMDATVLVVGDDGSTSVLPPPQIKTPDYIALIKDHPEVGEALKLLGVSAHSLGWVELYKLYEVVRDHAGGDKGLKSKGWATNGDLSAFTASANRPDVSGPGARHARAAGANPPRLTMNLDGGREFIRKLVKAWMDSLV